MPNKRPVLSHCAKCGYGALFKRDARGVFLRGRLSIRFGWVCSVCICGMRYATRERYFGRPLVIREGRQ
jgi:hypothetical protein